MKVAENGVTDGLPRMPVRAFDSGIIGKEQSYLLAVALVRDGLGGFLLSKRSERSERSERGGRGGGGGGGVEEGREGREARE